MRWTEAGSGKVQKTRESASVALGVAVFAKRLAAGRWTAELRSDDGVVHGAREFFVGNFSEVPAPLWRSLFEVSADTYVV